MREKPKRRIAPSRDIAPVRAALRKLAPPEVCSVTDEYLDAHIEQAAISFNARCATDISKELQRQKDLKQFINISASYLHALRSLDSNTDPRRI
jgi:hypothetical protein